MKKIFALCMLITCVLLSACQGNNNEKSKQSQKPTNQSYPFAKMEEKSVCDVTVTLVPPNRKLKLRENQMEHLVQLLKKIKTYEKISYEESTGQMINCYISTNKEKIKIQIMNPIIIINGNWYKASYNECEEINKYLNGLIS